eukprot:SAG22_NODE_1575_length_4081_cov_6.202632_3_plen_146_part_00
MNTMRAGPTANFLTHLFYLDLLEPLWRKLPRLVVDPTDKAGLGILALFPLLLSTVRCLGQLPQAFRKDNAQNLLSWFPLHRQFLNGRQIAKQKDALFAATRKWFPHRYTDDEGGQTGSPPRAGAAVPGVALLMMPPQAREAAARL